MEEKNSKPDSVFKKLGNSIIKTVVSIFERTVGSLITIISKLYSQLPIEVRIIIIVLIAGISAFLIFNKTTTTTQVAATHTGYEKIDKLYTSFTVVPIIKKSYSAGFTRHYEDTISFWIEKEISTDDRVDGFVVAYYAMSIGYDKVSDKLEPFIGKKCPADLNDLPEPTILSLKADVSPPEGNAEKLQDQLYVKKSNRKLIKNILLKKLKNRGQWNELVGRGKKILNAYISLYCVEEE